MLKAVSIELYVREAAPYLPLMTRLGLTARPVTTELTIFEGEATVILHAGGAHLPASHPFAEPLAEGAARGVGTEICLEVDDIDAVFEAAGAMAGFRVAEPLGMRPWGLKDFRLVTPDGYYLRIMEPR